MDSMEIRLPNHNNPYYVTFDSTALGIPKKQKVSV
jgi:hypothetical protein